MKNKLLTMVISAAVSLSLCIPAFAGQWLSNANGWFWQNDDGSYPASEWVWIDGDGDSISECYYFDENGYCLVNTMTPDGYMVNNTGAWTVDGDIQRQSAVPQATPAPVMDNPGQIPPEQAFDSLPQEMPQPAPEPERHPVDMTTPKANLDLMTPDYISNILDDNLTKSFISGGIEWEGATMYSRNNWGLPTRDYYLGGQYTTLTFNAVPYSDFGSPDNTSYTLRLSNQETGKVLYQKKGIKADTKVFSATVDVSGVQYLRIEFEPEKTYGRQSVLLMKDQYLY